MKIRSLYFVIIMCILSFYFSDSIALATDSAIEYFDVKSSVYTVTYNNSQYDNINTISDIPSGTSVNTFLCNIRNDNPDYLIDIFTYKGIAPKLFEKVSQLGNCRMYICVRKNAADTGEKFILIPQIKTELDSDFEKYAKGVFQNDDIFSFTKSSQNIGDANIIEEETGNRLCEISFSKTGDSYPVLETGLLKLPENSRSELSFKLRNYKSKIRVRLRDSNSSTDGHYIEPVNNFEETIRCFSSQNYIESSNGENLSIDNGTWVKFRIVFERLYSDNSKNSISVFINDEEIPSKKAIFSSYTDFNWNEFKVEFRASPTAALESIAQCDLDDFSYGVISGESIDSAIVDYNTYSTNEMMNNEYSGALINGNNKIKVKITNPSFPLTLYAAEKSEGELVGLSVCKLASGNADSEYLTAELNIKDAVNNQVELYVWEDNSLKPLGTVTTPKVSKINKAISNGHPRILADKEIFSDISGYTHSRQNEWKTKVISYADDICDSYTTRDKESEFYIGDELDFSDTSRYRIKKFGSVLGMAYQLTKEEKYCKKFHQIAMDSSNHIGWSDGSLTNLTAAYMIEGLSLGFDWCYDGLSEEERQDIADYAIEKCLAFALDEYHNKSRNSHTWSVTYTNHNAIPNSSFIIGSIAFAEYNPQLCQTVLDYSCERLKIFLAGLFPDGGWWEGASYTNLVYAHLAKASETLKLNFGFDDVIADKSFINKSADFFIGITGPKGSYNFAEQGTPQSNIIPEMLWLANVAERGYVRSWSLERINFDNAANCVLSLIWVDNPDNEGYTFSNNYTRGIEQITLGNGNEGSASWLSVLGGTNLGVHKHLDLGSFVYDYNGVRWATELGLDNYYKGYHGETSAGKIFYRSRAEGHNTLEINPSSASGGQRMNDENGVSKAEVIKYNLRSDKPYAVYDMSTAYSDNASSVKRGFRLLDDNIGFVIRDEFTCLSDGDIVNWYMHTDASIELSDDGKSAVLTQDGKSVKLYVIEENLSFSVADAITPEPVRSELLAISKENSLELHKQNWNGYKDGDTDTSNDMKKLKITHSGKSDGTITVVLLPINEIVPENANMSLDSWN